MNYYDYRIDYHLNKSDAKLSEEHIHHSNLQITVHLHC